MISYIWYIILAVVIILYVWRKYNTFVIIDTGVENQWGKVQSAYERRLDLIPHVAATVVKGSAAFEQDIQTQITALRSGLKKVKNLDDKQKLNSQMSTLLNGLNVEIEAYPDIKSTDNFKGLMNELAITENLVKKERDAYNDIVQEYKIKVRSFPANLIAGILGFRVSKWNTFKSNEDANIPTDISFCR